MNPSHSDKDHTMLRADHHEAADSPAVFERAAVVQLMSDDPLAEDALVAELHDATVTVEATGIRASGEGLDWRWEFDDLVRVVHAADEPWSILYVPDVEGFGVAVPAPATERFRALLAAGGFAVETQERVAQVDGEGSEADATTTPVNAWPVPVAPVSDPIAAAGPSSLTVSSAMVPTADAAAQPVEGERRRRRRTIDRIEDIAGPVKLTGLDARSISAWFGTHQVLDRVSLEMAPGKVTALIGPSGCGKSTFLRILNRMHEMIPGASMAGEVLLDGEDVYDSSKKLTDARSQIGMVFQKPNPFPAMSIYDNVLAALRVTGLKATTAVKDELVESCLLKAGLWNEVKDRLRQPGGGLSGGQQQRLCIARALAIRPRVLLMDEPCSALDPTSTRRIEETIIELISEVTIVIVTHNMQQAARVSDNCAFFLAEQGTPGVIVEHGPTDAMFDRPQDPRTDDYVNGRFG